MLIFRQLNLLRIQCVPTAAREAATNITYASFIAFSLHPSSHHKLWPPENASYLQEAMIWCLRTWIHFWNSVQHKWSLKSYWEICSVQKILLTSSLKHLKMKPKHGGNLSCFLSRTGAPDRQITLRGISWKLKTSERSPIPRTNTVRITAFKHMSASVIKVGT